MKPEEYLEIRNRNEAKIRRLQKEIDTAEQLAVDSPPPSRENLRLATIEDVRNQRVLWLDFGGALEWRIPLDEPHPNAQYCIEIDGNSMEWLGSFVEVVESKTLK